MCILFFTLFLIQNSHQNYGERWWKRGVGYNLQCYITATAMRYLLYFTDVFSILIVAVGFGFW